MDELRNFVEFKNFEKVLSHAQNQKGQGFDLNARISLISHGTHNSFSKTDP